MSTVKEHLIGATPSRLNGYPVVKCDKRRGVLRSDAFIVMVHREGHPTHPYVVATWSPSCGTEWVWGNYCKDRDEAERVFLEKT
jgi:hypothetical protein